MHPSIVEWKFPHHSITEFNIKNVVIFASCEELVTWIVLCLLDCAHIRAHIGVLVNYFTDFFPLLLRYLPHVGFGHSVIFKNFNFTLRIPI